MNSFSACLCHWDPFIIPFCNLQWFFLCRNVRSDVWFHNHHNHVLHLDIDWWSEENKSERSTCHELFMDCWIDYLQGIMTYPYHELMFHPGIMRPISMRNIYLFLWIFYIFIHHFLTLLEDSWRWYFLINLHQLHPTYVNFSLRLYKSHRFWIYFRSYMIYLNIFINRLIQNTIKRMNSSDIDSWA